MNARWMTPSDARAAAASPSTSDSSPRCTSAPSRLSVSAAASLRASPTTRWPAPSSSGTTAVPMNPVAPVTNRLMTISSWSPGELSSSPEREKTRTYTGMGTNTLAGSTLTLGGFLRDRRARLSPGPGRRSRRRTPGLRREEVATRAGVSVTWYTWLEQGRGGPPSDEVLERLARALELDASGREVLFLLAHHRPPPIEPAGPTSVPEALQRLIDALPTSPAFVRTMTWDVVAWNAAA